MIIKLSQEFPEIDELFYELEVIRRGKNVYYPDVNKLLATLKSKDNSYRFWKSPHIKKVYDISNEFSFLLSIYTEETDENLYEDWLFDSAYNPFGSGMVINYSRLKKYERYSYYNLSDFEEFISSFGSGTRTKFSNEDIKDFKKARLLKTVPYDKLLDRRIYDNHLVPSYTDFKGERFVILLNPLYIMGTHYRCNFIRLDTYNAWRKTLKDEWKILKEFDNCIIEVLDALVASRKAYMEYIKMIDERKKENKPNLG